MAATKPPAGQETKAAHGYIGDKDRYLARLKRIEGQARGIHRMVDEDTYCIDILTQISALTSASAERRPRASSTTTSRTASSAPPKPEAPRPRTKIAEASKAIARLVKS
jgi:DNA-binding FrmR family transcriptional regulator